MKLCGMSAGALLLGMAVCLAAQAQTVETPLSYQEIERNAATYRPRGYLRVEMKDEPPRPVRLPDWPGAVFRYFTFELGDTEVLGALGRRDSGSKIRYTSYADGDGDGTFEVTSRTNTFEASNRKSTWGVSSSFEPCQIDYELAGLRHKFSFNFSFSEQLEPTGKQVGNSSYGVMTNCVYTGKVKVGGVEYDVAIGDCKVNGDFGDRLKEEYSGEVLSPQGDIIVFSAEGKDSSSFLLTEYVLFGEELYRLGIDFPKQRLWLTREERELAAVILEEVERLQLFDPDSGSSFAAISPGPEIQLPLGRWKLVNYRLSRTTNEGDVWCLSATGTSKSPVWTVEGPNPAVFEFGEPYETRLQETNLKLAPSEDEEGKKEYRLAMEAVGVAEERISSLYRLKGNGTGVPMSRRSVRAPKEPFWKIVTAEGEILAEGNFEYG